VAHAHCWGDHFLCSSFFVSFLSEAKNPGSFLASLAVKPAACFTLGRGRGPPRILVRIKMRASPHQNFLCHTAAVFKW